MIIRSKTDGLIAGHVLITGRLFDVENSVGRRLVSDGQATEATIEEYVLQVAGSPPPVATQEKRILKPKEVRYAK